MICIKIIILAYIYSNDEKNLTKIKMMLIERSNILICYNNKEKTL